MPEYLSPGVYIEEIDTGNKPIEGVGTSTAGFVGLTVRGPTKPCFITSFGEFSRVYGRYRDDAFLPHAVEGFFQNGGKRCFVARALSTGATTAKKVSGGLEILAIGPGAWPNEHLLLKIKAGSLTSEDNPLFKITIFYWETSPPQDPVIDPSDPSKISDVKRRDPTFTEEFDNLSMDEKKSNFCERQINDFSNFITVSRQGDALPDLSDDLVALDASDDGSKVKASDIAGDEAAEPGQRRGLAALADIDEIAILCCPEEFNTDGVEDPDALYQPVITQCELLKDRFAIIQSRRDGIKVDALVPSQASKYAAFYYPWLQIVHPISGRKLTIPPGGHMAGIYARVDTERGVHKAPANEFIRGLDPGTDGKGGLQVQVNTRQQDLLNPRGVNVLRYFVGYGNLVWGARTTTRDPDWKYINVRRLFIFVEESIEEATKWAVFEPNDEPLWARLRRSVSAFLRGLWLQGQLQGEKAERAYFVKCDRTTMTQADIDNGRLIMVIGIAPVKPAEFVIFRIGQWDGGHSVEETKA